MKQAPLGASSKEMRGAGGGVSGKREGKKGKAASETEGSASPAEAKPEGDAPADAKGKGKKGKAAEATEVAIESTPAPEPKGKKGKAASETEGSAPPAEAKPEGDAPADAKGKGKKGKAAEATEVAIESTPAPEPKESIIRKAATVLPRLIDFLDSRRTSSKSFAEGRWNGKVWARSGSRNGADGNTELSGKSDQSCGIGNSIVRATPKLLRPLLLALCCATPSAAGIQEAAVQSQGGHTYLHNFAANVGNTSGIDRQFFANHGLESVAIQVSSDARSWTVGKLRKMMQDDKHPAEDKVDAVTDHPRLLRLAAAFASALAVGYIGTCTYIRCKSGNAPGYGRVPVDSSTPQDDEDLEEWVCGFKVFMDKPGDKEKEKAAYGKLGFLDKIMLRKNIFIIKGAATIAAKAADIILDVTTGSKFYATGDYWWSFMTFAIILLSPVPQFLYIVCQRGPSPEALLYLLPGSCVHLRKQWIHVRFCWKLPQYALFEKVQNGIATGALAEILGGIEGFCESLPQAILQSRAYVVRGGNWINLLSIAFSTLGVFVGGYFTYSAAARKGKGHDVYQFKNETSFLDGKSCIAPKLKDRRLVSALSYLAASDTDIKKWNLDLAEVGDSISRIMRNCPHVEEISLIQASVGDQGVQEIATNCPQLHTIELAGTKVTDQGVQELAIHCRDLKEITLWNTRVTDAGVKEIAKNCPNLQLIYLSGTKVTDAGVKEIATHCPQLHTILLSETKVTDQGVQEIARNCPNLSVIGLSETSVTDAGVQELAKNCRELREIGLIGTKVTDAGIQELLKKCNELKKLEVPQSLDDRRGEWRKQYPNVEIE